MNGVYYVGLDVHKKSVSWCAKLADGTVVEQGKLKATRCVLHDWAKSLKCPWIGVMEATLFTAWIYDLLKPYAKSLVVGHPARLKAICSGKKKSDRIDAAMLADLLRADLVPEVWMAPPDIRYLRDLLRYRTATVQMSTRMKNKISGLLMTNGIEYDSRRLHGKRYFNELLSELTDTPPSVKWMMKQSRQSVQIFTSVQKDIVRSLERNKLLKERVERLKQIPSIGSITALTWALEVGDPNRLGSVAKAISYCGLCSALQESAGKQMRGPLSKQRNKHLQTILIEAAKLAPTHCPELARLHEKELMKGHKNRATLAVARKLVAWLLAVDKKKEDFVPALQTA
jgi:transposase